MMTTSPSGFSRNRAGSGKGWSVSRMLRGSGHDRNQVSTMQREGLWQEGSHSQPWLQEGLMHLMLHSHALLLNVKSHVEAFSGQMAHRAQSLTQLCVTDELESRTVR